MSNERKLEVLNILEDIFLLYTISYALDSYIMLLPEPSAPIKILTVLLSAAGIIAMARLMKHSEVESGKRKLFRSTMITVSIADCIVVLSLLIHTPIRDMGFL